MPSICNCRICERDSRVYAIQDRGNVAEMRALIQELYEALGNVEFDHEVKSAILDGSWPTAREYAERILERTKKS